MKILAPIVNIQRFSLHDGPGVRSVVFFKGCSLNCSWCQNPEAIGTKPEISWDEKKCIGCFSCQKSCPYNAILIDSGQRINWDRCNDCGICTETCPSGALELIGKELSSQQIITEILKDHHYYERSGGGVTLSGGEPLLHIQFLKQFLPELKKHHLNINVETAGNYPLAHIQELLPYFDLIYFDLKFPQVDGHRLHTGRDNRLVINNLRFLLSQSVPLKVRIPMVPGVNDQKDHIFQFQAILKELNINRITLLKYNSLWETKLRKLRPSRKSLNLSYCDDSFNYAYQLFKELHIYVEIE